MAGPPAYRGAARRRAGASLALCLLLAGAAAAETVVLPRGSTWKYDATGVDLGAAWRAAAYHDASWPQGPAPLGYGDPGIATVVPYGPDPSNKHRTTYFRRTFELSIDPALVTALVLRANYDDGFVAYVNGQEVARRSLPAGTITYATLATSHEGGAYEELFVFPPAHHLTAGTNTIAVEVHQTSPTSSDLQMDIEVAYSTVPIVTRGPYLQLGGPTGITVRWRTGTPCDSRVRYGAAPGDATGVASDTASVTEHEVAIGGLSPSTRYFYSVGTAAEVLAGGDSAHAFTTAPPVGAATPVRLWVIGDSGTGNSMARAVRDAFEAYGAGRRTDFFMMLGDNAYSTGTDANYQSALFDMYPEVLRRMVLWPTRGNHDQVFAGPNNDYYDFFSLPAAGQLGGVPSGTEAYYSFDYANLHFVCLDSEESSRLPGGPMLSWLEADLAATTQDWVVAWWHHPPYTRGSHDSDDPGDSGGRMRDMARNALPILEAYGVDLVLTGHSHSYERSWLIDGHYGDSTTWTAEMVVDSGDGRIDGDGAYVKPGLGRVPHQGAVYVVAGSSGHTSGGPLNHRVMVQAMNELGSAVVDVDGLRLDLRFLDTARVVRDSVTIVKGPLVGAPSASVVASPVLHPGRPNPFGSGTRIPYELTARTAMSLAVTDVHGRRIRTLVRGVGDPGRHEARWDGRDAGGRRLPPGVYFAVLEHGATRAARKLVLME